MPCRASPPAGARCADLRLDHEVDVVLALRAAARPRGEPAAQDERDLVPLKRSGTRLHGIEQLLEGRLGHYGVVSGLSDCATWAPWYGWRRQLISTPRTRVGSAWSARSPTSPERRTSSCSPAT